MKAFYDATPGAELRAIALRFAAAPPPFPIPPLGGVGVKAPEKLHEHVRRVARQTFDKIKQDGKRKASAHVNALKEAHRDLERAMKFIRES